MYRSSEKSREIAACALKRIEDINAFRQAGLFTFSAKHKAKQCCVMGAAALCEDERADEKCFTNSGWLYNLFLIKDGNPLAAFNADFLQTADALNIDSTIPSQLAYRINDDGAKEIAHANVLAVLRAMIESEVPANG